MDRLWLEPTRLRDRILLFEAYSPCVVYAIE
jgi:hypothetical protein